MHEYYFANYRLLVDDEISNGDYMEYLAAFGKAMPATHTFTLHLGDEALLERKIAEATNYPVVCTTERFDIHDTQDSWSFVSQMDEEIVKIRGKFVLTCARDYSEMTLYISRQPYYEERIQRWITPGFPVSSAIRAACEAGMTMRDGMRSGFCFFRFKQRFVAQMKRKSMSSRHYLTETSQVVHILIVIDGIIHQQAIIGKVVFVHTLKDSWE